MNTKFNLGQKVKVEGIIRSIFVDSDGVMYEIYVPMADKKIMVMETRILEEK